MLGVGKDREKGGFGSRKWDPACQLCSLPARSNRGKNSERGLWEELHQEGYHLVQRADSLEKTLLLGKIEGKKRRRQQMR